MPKQMNDDEARSAVAAVIKDVGAANVKDMGKVMAALKAKFNEHAEVSYPVRFGDCLTDSILP